MSDKVAFLSTKLRTSDQKVKEKQPVEAALGHILGLRHVKWVKADGRMPGEDLQS
jgi:hypothetical protein